MALGKSASGQALGYLYQFERAIYWLSKADIDFVSIETDDDVVAQLNAGNPINRIYEQDKSSIGSSNPFSNSNINLWKTLAIWLSIQKRSPKEKARFILATNKRVPTTCIAYKVHKENFISGHKTSQKILEDFYNELQAVGVKLKGKGKEIFDNISIAYTKDEFISLLGKIVVSSEEFFPDRNKFKEEIKTNLRIGAQVPFNLVYEKVFGWMADKIINLWSSNQEGTVKSSDLIDMKDICIKEALDKPFVELAASSIPVFDYERKEHQEKDFIRQLSFIDTDEDDIIDAIDDFLRASKERDRWAENGTVPGQEDIDELERDIRRNWKKHVKRHSIKSKTTPDLTEIDIGNLIYLDSSDSQGYNLAGYPVIQNYTVVGSLHILSDKLAIGWHPSWRKLFNVKEEHNED
ncbi:ABC-three component system protein [Pedobacter psychrodurus]|uniref:ABC-three component system protein n=1 Tax=Pedobacter psychrodurus TaxID=2530456 RepID=UPI00292D90B0|nr:ABC-three component system protein [Pedobacter psychrodurus]